MKKEPPGRSSHVNNQQTVDNENESISDLVDKILAEGDWTENRAAKMDIDDLLKCVSTAVVLASTHLIPRLSGCSLHFTSMEFTSPHENVIVLWLVDKAEDANEC